MTYLIDGYNLLHALGLLQARVGPHGLEKARLRLLCYLSGAYGADAPAVTVVFDAHAAPAGVAEQYDYHGLHVRYAVHHPEADDLIEQLIRQDSAPRQLTVISDDHRLQKAARRRQCHVLGCLDYMEELERNRQARRQTQERTEKREGISGEEMQHWLQEFANLQLEPELNALEPFDYREEGFE